MREDDNNKKEEDVSKSKKGKNVTASNEEMKENLIEARAKAKLEK